VFSPPKAEKKDASKAKEGFASARALIVPLPEWLITTVRFSRQKRKTKDVKKIKEKMLTKRILAIRKDAPLLRERRYAGGVINQPLAEHVQNL
jgi:hypothetical protein